MTQKQYRNIDRYQDLLNRIAPTRLVEQTRQSVIGHEGSLEAFVTALSFEVNRCVMLARGADPRDVLSPAAILVMGSTGTGKTHTIKAVADAAGLKLFVFDVSTMTGEGWRGASMSNCLSQVADYQAANPGEICLVLFDEFDKAVRAEPDGGEVASSFSPSQSFLKLLEGGEMPFECDTSKSAAIKTLNLDQVVCILGGAFMGLDALVRKRLSDKSGTTVGFGSSYAAVRTAAKSANELRDSATIEDVETWGIMSELCGRIGSVINFNALSVDDLVQIAYEQYLPKYNNMMGNGAKMELMADAARLAAKRAVKEGAGARGMLRQLRPLMMYAWRDMREDTYISRATLVVSDGELAVAYEHSHEPRGFLREEMGKNSPFLNGREIEALALVSNWMEHEDEDEHKPYQPEFAWLADLVDGSALDKIVQGGKAFDLAGVLLCGVPFDGPERIAAHELLKACACYNDVLYADKEQYRNLAQVLTLTKLVYKKTPDCLLSPLDVVMNGTTTGNGFQGLGEWVDAMSRSEKPSLEKWQYLAAGEALRIYDHFSKRPDQVKELAAEVSLMRVALAVMDVEEREALECDLEKLLASCE